MYSLTLDTQEYEELSLQLFLYKIISQLLFDQLSLTPPPMPALYCLNIPDNCIFFIL